MNGNRQLPLTRCRRLSSIRLVIRPWWPTLTLSAGLLGCEAASSGPEVDPAARAALIEARRQATNPEGQTRLGWAALRAEQWFEAAESFAAAKEQGVDSPELHAGLARTYVRLGYPDATIGALRACFRQAPRQPDCLYAFGALIEADSSEAAQRELQRTWARFLLVAPPDHDKRGYAESALAQLNGRFGPLSEEEVKGPQPQASQAASAPAQSGAGPADHPGGDPQASQGVGELNPFGQALQKAYRAWSEGDRKAAETHLREALALRPTDAGTLADLARLQLEQSRLEEAVTTVEKAWSIDPQNAQVRFSFGLVMLRAQRRGKEALQAWHDLMKDSPDYAKELGVEKLLNAAGQTTP